MQGQRAEVEWRDGDVPVSTRFDDPYYSLEDGLAESRYVFLEGNGLPDRFAPGFHIAELGFGTGLNVLAAWSAWDQAQIAGPLRVTSFEAFPLPSEEMGRALSAFPQIARYAEALLRAWDPAGGQFDLGSLHVTVMTEDARSALPHWAGRADAWFLDGFSPAKNPELWEPELLAQVGRHTTPGGTVATYTAAGFVRRGLAEAGFVVERRAGFGRKRHMTVGRIP